MPKKRAATGEAAFLQFVQVCMEEEALADTLRKLATVPAPMRAAFLEMVAGQMRAGGVPEEIVAVAKKLSDQALFDRLLDVIGR